MAVKNSHALFLYPPEIHLLNLIYANILFVLVTKNFPCILCRFQALCILLFTNEITVSQMTLYRYKDRFLYSCKGLLCFCWAQIKHGYAKYMQTTLHTIVMHIIYVINNISSTAKFDSWGPYIWTYLCLISSEYNNFYVNGVRQCMCFECKCLRLLVSLGSFKWSPWSHFLRTSVPCISGPMQQFQPQF